MKTVKIQFLKTFTAITMMACAATSAWTQERTERAPVPVVNYSGVSGIGEYIAARSTDDQYALFARNQDLAVFALVSTFGQDKPWCVAHVGLTHKPYAQGMPRMPSTRFFGGASDPAFGMEKCKTTAITRALDRMLAKEPAQLQEDIITTKVSGGQRPALKPDKTLTRSSYAGMTKQGDKYVNDLMPDWFSRAFDYRAVIVVKRYLTIDGDNGQLICLASIGLTARPPEGREPNEPLAESARSRVLNEDQRKQADTDSVCFDPLFEHLVKEQLTPGSDLIQTFIRTWSKVAEPGLKAPSHKDVQTAVAWQAERDRQTALKRKRDEARHTRVAEANSCSVSCVNGDCVRRWPNGRSERFQAPRKFNPLKSQWEWDTSGC